MHKQDRFYEIDLPALIDTGDPEAFLYCYAFFHRSAFEPHPLGVAALLRESADYAHGVSDTLKAQVYDALRHLAQGFLDYSGNRLQLDRATLKTIYDHALIVLYRLLFILYAEARELLPLRASELYRGEYSLFALTRDVERKLRAGVRLLPTSATLWPRLQALFQIINAGSPPLKVATFNGGLFDGQRYPFLEQHTVGDAHLLQAIDMLARVDEQFIDYRDLAERHLGTIYEGLLEYHLQPIAAAGSWTIDLFDDRGERHRTGSYYTPEFVVQYMVEQTVGPVLHAAVEGKQRDAEKVAAVLNVNLADPAMGSGHFLVAATEYIARFLVDLAITPGADSHGEADLAYWKRRVVQNCIYGVDLNPLAVDLAKLSLWLATVAQDRPLSFLDHHLRCGNALVGTRIADLDDRPGTIYRARTTDDRRRRASKPNRKAKIQNRKSVDQLSMLDDEGFRQSMSTAVSSMWLIEGTAGNTVEEVREQERLYVELRETLTRKYARLADLVTATRFGVQIDPALRQPLADYATGRTLAAPAKFNEWLDAAAQVATAQRVFHWDLEFPEVFFDRHGQPLGEQAGFDAVLGNPPYVRQEQL
ncbi:MAG TPA: N-6 DNA methylase, partial [Roseiflexaceae bacterium]